MVDRVGLIDFNTIIAVDLGRGYIVVLDKPDVLDAGEGSRRLCFISAVFLRTSPPRSDWTAMAPPLKTSYSLRIL